MASLTALGLLLTLVTAQTEDPNYGLKTEQIGTMSIASWLAHAEKAKGQDETVTEAEIREDLYTLANAANERTKSLIKSKPKAYQTEINALNKNTKEFMNHLYDFEISISGGGTMYLFINSYRHADTAILVRDLVEGKLKDPGNLKVSDGTKAIEKMIARMKKIPMDSELGQSRSGAEKAGAKALNSYKAATLTLKNRSRKDSNAVIHFFREMANLDVLKHFEEGV
jgi:hypothetical protein